MEIPKAIQYGLRAISVVGITLYSLPSSIEGQISPLEVFVECENSKPTVKVIGDVTAAEDQTLWLSVTPAGRRDTRLLKKGRTRLMFSKQYQDVFQPDGQYTDYPISPLSFKEGSIMRLGIHYGGVNKIGNPLLTDTIIEHEFVIPSCTNTNKN